MHIMGFFLNDLEGRDKLKTIWNKADGAKSAALKTFCMCCCK